LHVKGSAVLSVDGAAKRPDNGEDKARVDHNMHLLLVESSDEMLVVKYVQEVAPYLKATLE